MIVGKEDTVMVGSRSWRLPPALQRAPELIHPPLKPPFAYAYNATPEEIFSELDQYDWLALILPVSYPSHSSPSCPGTPLIIPAGPEKLVLILCLCLWGLREPLFALGHLTPKKSEGFHWNFTSQVVSEGLHRVTASSGSEWTPAQRLPQYYLHCATDSRKVERVARLWDTH